MMLRTIERLGEEASFQEVSPRQRLSRRKVTPSYPQAQPRSECSHGRRARSHDPEGGAQEAVHDGDLCHRGAGAEKEVYDGRGFGPTNGKMK